MSIVSNGISADQAAGLRDIFGAEICRVVCIASTLDADTTITLGHGTAHKVRQLGHRVLLVDEIALSDRKTMTGFLYPTRYDLGQVFSGSVELGKSIKQVDENLWYATSVKLRTEVTKRFAKYPKLDQRLIDFNLNIDYVIFPTVDPQANIVAYYGSNIKRIIVTATDPKSLKKALIMARKMSELQFDEPLSVLMVGGKDENEGAAAFEKLQAAAQSALEQPLESIGWIRALTAQRVEVDQDDLSLNPVNRGITHEFVLPQGFFESISAKITT